MPTWSVRTPVTRRWKTLSAQHPRPYGPTDPYGRPKEIDGSGLAMGELLNCALCGQLRAHGPVAGRRTVPRGRSATGLRQKERIVDREGHTNFVHYLRFCTGIVAPMEWLPTSMATKRPDIYPMTLRQWTVDGRPFILAGREVNNMRGSSASSQPRRELAYVRAPTRK